MTAYTKDEMVGILVHPLSELTQAYGCHPDTLFRYERGLYALLDRLYLAGARRFVMDIDNTISLLLIEYLFRQCESLQWKGVAYSVVQHLRSGSQSGLASDVQRRAERIYYVPDTFRQSSAPKSIASAISRALVQASSQIVLIDFAPERHVAYGCARAHHKGIHAVLPHTIIAKDDAVI